MSREIKKPWNQNRFQGFRGLERIRTAVEAFAELCKRDRKSTRLNSSHQIISYAVFCLKKKKKNIKSTIQCIRANIFRVKQRMHKIQINNQTKRNNCNVHTIAAAISHPNHSISCEAARI